MSQGARSGRLAQNASWLLYGHVASKLATLVALLLLARYFGPLYFGRFALALAIPASIEALADLGISQALVRESATHPGRLPGLLAAGFLPKAMLVLALPPLTYVIAVAFDYPSEVIEAAVYLGIAKAIESLTYLGRSVFAARERMEYEAASLALDSVVRVTFAAYAIASGFGVIGLAKSLAIAALVVLAGTLIIFARRADVRIVRPSWILARMLLLLGAPFAASWLLDSLVLRAGVLIAAGAGDVTAGLYAAAARLVEPMFIIPAMVGAALLPLVSRHLVEERVSLAALFAATVKLTLLVGTGIAVGTFALAPVLVDVLFGPSFAAAVPALRVLALALVFSFIRVVVIYIALALRRPWRLLAAQAAGLATNVAVALALVGALGPAAPALGVLAGEVIAVALLLSIVPELRFQRTAGALRFLWLSVPALAVTVLSSAAGEAGAAVAGLAVLAVLVRAAGAVTASEVDYLTDALPVFGRVRRIFSAAVRSR